MLGKLIKYEWKATYKVSVVIIIAIAAITMIGLLGMILPYNSIKNNYRVSEDSAEWAFWFMMMGVTLIIYVITLIVATFGMLIYLGINFFKTMFTDEGYLTHTLPVNSGQLFFSKTLVGGIWYLIVEIAVLISVILLIISFYNISNTYMDLGDLVKETNEAFVDIYGMANSIHAIISALLVIFVSPFCTIMILYGALTVGQLSRKYKAFMGILTYLGCSLANSILKQMLQFALTYGPLMMGDGKNLGNINLYSNYDSTLLAALILSIPLCIASNYILKNKLNLD